jgi:hypothetical protein
MIPESAILVPRYKGTIVVQPAELRRPQQVVIRKLFPSGLALYAAGDQEYVFTPLDNPSEGSGELAAVVADSYARHLPNTGYHPQFVEHTRSGELRFACLEETIDYTRIMRMSTSVQTLQEISKAAPELGHYLVAARKRLAQEKQAVQVKWELWRVLERLRSGQ